MKKTIQSLIESNIFQHLVTFLIIFNGITMGLATSKAIMTDYAIILSNIDNTIVALFTIEVLMRIFVYRFSFFKSPWNLFDFFVVSISLIPFNEGLSILRVLRVLRLFRLFTIVPQMRLIISAILGVIPGMASVSLVLLVFFYVFAIMGTNLYGATFPQWFGTLGESMYTLFQIMTLESWSMGIARPILEVHTNAWLFFVIYILIVTFIMVNLFIGIVVDAIFTIKENDKNAKMISEESDEDKIDSLSQEIKELKSLVNQINNKLH